MEYQVVSSSHSGGLTSKVNTYIKDGWRPISGHLVVEVHRQNRFSGSQHIDTKIEVEYSQSMTREVIETEFTNQNQ